MVYIEFSNTICMEVPPTRELTWEYIFAKIHEDTDLWHDAHMSAVVEYLQKGKVDLPDHLREMLPRFSPNP